MSLRAMALLIVLLSAGPLRAAEPLYLHEPFDRITLNEQNDNAVLVVRPMDLPDRKLPQEPASTDTLKFRLLDAPQKLYELQWQHIAKVELFETMLLDEAKGLVAKGQFGAAYDSFRVLRTRYPKLPGLEAAYEACLLAEALQAQRDGKYDKALTSLLALRDRRSKVPELPAALSATVEKLVEKHVADEDYTGARRLLEELAGWDPEQTLGPKYQAQFQKQAAELVQQGKKAVGANDYRQADQAVRRAQQIWPESAGLKELASQVHAKYPRLVVGVSVPAERPDPNSLTDWAARRAGRIVARPLVLYAGPGAQGGNYSSPVGQIEVDKSLRRVEVRLRNDVRWSKGDGLLTGFDAARALVARCDPTEPGYLPGWSDLLQQVRVYDIWRVEVGLQHACPRPEAFLASVLRPYTDPALLSEPGVGCGPYVFDRRGEEVTYLANDRHPGKPGRPREIAEVCLSKPGTALAALTRGQIQAIDRLCPWELGAAKGLKQVSVQAYAVPTVHCLLPNLKRTLPGDRRFRRAVVYGIDRSAILGRLTAGQTVPGCAILSGPFPAARGGESFGYASDEAIAPRPYDPRLALALAAQAVPAAATVTASQTTPTASGAADSAPPASGPPESAAKPDETAAGTKPAPSAEPAKDQESPKAGPPPKAPEPVVPLVLGHPAEPVARRACGLIRQHLALAGIQVTLRELKPGEEAAAFDQVDFLYAELLLWEPLVDARRLLGSDGLLGQSSPPLDLALRQLERATQWNQACAALRQIHRLVHEEAAVIPLWQLTEHRAVHDSLQGLPSAPVSMYDEVQQWQIQSNEPAQSKPAAAKPTEPKAS